ncbi:MAG: hypothetical protein Q7S64_03315, partial [bacterium]|nr:hypothetical protein [bacterium]
MKRIDGIWRQYQEITTNPVIRRRVRLCGGLGGVIFVGLALVLGLSGPRPVQAELAAVNSQQASLQDNGEPSFATDSSPTFTLDTAGLVKLAEGESVNGTLLTNNGSIKAEVSSPRETIKPQISSDSPNQRDNDRTFAVTVPQAELKHPGKYVLSITIKGSRGEQHLTQNFYWGVLALNFNQSTYKIGERAELGLAVLDNNGHTLCDAQLNLKVIAPNGQETALSTAAKSITVADTCAERSVTNVPDYQTTYTPSVNGQYRVELTAETSNGQRFMTDLFEVTDQAPFVVKRAGPTRIYPPATYEMTVSVTAQQDFQGELREKIPGTIVVSEERLHLKKRGNADFTPYTSRSFTTNVDGQQTMAWPNIALEPGDELQLTYQFKTPNISPEFYLLGKLELVDEITVQGDSTTSQISVDPALLVERSGLRETTESNIYELTTRVNVRADFAGVAVDAMPDAVDVIAERIIKTTKEVAADGKISVTKGVIRSMDDASSIDDPVNLNLVSDGQVKKIIWQVPWRAGESYDLVYKIDASKINPSVLAHKFKFITSTQNIEEINHDAQLWSDLAKPLSNLTYNLVYQEPRFWQIAADSTTSAKYPSVAADATGVGTVAWLNYGSVTADDTSFATCSPTDNGICHYLKSTSYGFTTTDVPTGSRIDGITATVLKKASAVSRIKDYAVRIVKGGTIDTTVNYADTTNWWGTGEVASPYGGAADKWGLSWGVSDITATGFGLAFSANKPTTSTGAYTASVDYITLTVTYTPPLTVTGSSNGSGTVKMAINNSVQTAAPTISGSAFSITADAPAATNDIITVWIDGALDTAESTGVTKYAGSGAIAGMVLDTNILTLGSDQNQSLSVTELDTYDCTGDEDIMHQAASSTLLVEGTSCAGATNNSYTSEKISILASNTLTISGTETLTTLNLDNAGTLTSGGNSTYNISGNWNNTSTFTASTSTVTFNGSVAQTITAGGSSFNLVTFNNSSGSDPDINYTGALTIDSNVTLSNATKIASTDNTAITITGTINGANVLTINSGSGAVTLGGIIGGATPITSLASTGSGAVAINTTGITTRDVASNNVSFTGAVTLGANLTITTDNTTNDGTITFSSTINGAQTLTLANGGGTVTLGGVIGGTTPITSLAVSGSGSVAINTTGITTRDVASNNVSFTGAVTLGGGLTITTDNTTNDGTIIFSSTVNGNNALTLNAGTAQVTFNNNVGATQSIGVLTKQGTGDLKFGANTLTATGLTLSAGTINTAATDSGAWSVSGDVTISAGTLTATTNTLSVGGNWANSGTFTPNGGTVTFNKGSVTQTLNSGGVGAGKLFNNLTHSGAGTLQLITNAIDIDGIFTNSAGTFDANDLNMNVADDWLGSGGTFSADVSPGATTQTVTFDGTNEATVSGSNTFRNLTMNTTTDGAKTIKFTVGTIQTIGNTWTLDGAVTKVLTLRSTTDTNAWGFVIPADINPAGDYIDVKDSQNNTNAFRITPGANTTDSGNNVPGWLFAPANTPPNSPSSLLQKKVTGGATLATGDYTNETQVQFTAIASDPDATDTLYLCVEKDLLATALSSTNGGDLCGDGVAYTGTPVTVTVTITGLTDASEYHWQAQVKDAAAAYSSFVSYDVNTENPPTDPAARDFGVDTTAPTGGTVNDGTGADAAYNDGSLSSLSANWSGVTATVSGLLKYEYAIG